jgi:hypothetical protein
MHTQTHTDTMTDTETRTHTRTHTETAFICGHALKNRFGKFYLRAHNESVFVEQWLEKEEIPIVL